MLIHELERKTGLDRPTIRYYEKEGLISPMRTENGYRQYTDSDAETLDKIKLMRQLGVSVGKIKELNCGTENISSVISAQILALESQISKDTRASAVCAAILSDGANYATIDSGYYLKMFDQPDENAAGEKCQKFQEYIPKQVHPWRRYFARLLDYYWFGAAVNFIMTVIVRIRPSLSTFDTYKFLLPILCAALFVPLEAWFLHLWGTTPGKLSVGMRIERVEGGRLSFSDAFNRSKAVLCLGMGFHLPVISTILMIIRYCQLTGFRLMARHNSTEPPYDMEWDYNNEIHYDERAGKRYFVFASVLLLSILMICVTTMDSVKPKYPNGELTLEAFSENYNNMNRIIYPNADHVDMDTNGKWANQDRNVFYIEFGSKIAEENKNFDYLLENNLLKSVSYTQNWCNVTSLDPLSDRCYIAAITALTFQRGTNFFDLVRFNKLWKEESRNSTADFQYGNIRVQWSVTVDGEYTCVDAVYYSEKPDKPVRVALEFTVSMLEH